MAWLAGELYFSIVLWDMTMRIAFGFTGIAGAIILYVLTRDGR